MPTQIRSRPDHSSLTAIGSAAAPTAGPPAAVNKRRYAELNGHVGLAVIAIVVFHVYQFCNVNHFLYLGTPAYTLLNSLDAMIPWLFVLSAFLLFEPIARSVIDGQPAISVRGLFVRRAVRLLPLYYVVVLVVWFSRQVALPGDWRDLLEHLTFTQVFDEKRIFYTIGPAWAISVEVFFWLLLGVLTLGLERTCRHLAGRRQRIALLTGVIVALSTISMAWKAWAFAVAHRPTTGSFTTWFGPLANLDNFTVGMAAALIVVALGKSGNAGTIRPGSRLVLRLTGLAILYLAFATRRADTWTGVYFPITCAVGFGCLITAAALGRPDRWSRALNCRPLLWLATIAYSIYLWHEPIMLALRGKDGLIRQASGAFVRDAVVVVIVSILVGWLSFLVIERPTRRLGGIFGSDGHLLRPGRTKA